MTKRKQFQDSPLLKISALKAVLRGWINYYRHSKVKGISKNLDFWVNQRLFIWLGKRHKLPLAKVAEEINTYTTAPKAALISKLNLIIKGWSTITPQSSVKKHSQNVTTWYIKS
jgi:hypothetical protein